MRLSNYFESKVTAQKKNLQTAKDSFIVINQSFMHIRQRGINHLSLPFLQGYIC